jgi:hypothetical protein
VSYKVTNAFGGMVQNQSNNTVSVEIPVGIKG